ncbi:hypothetical protein QJQ58_15705 [Paenibacillus dendritiformis]|uniref:hypothetical protein n=1 Tax=Paenibacillus dendritiformis TaxID=130049 RepID=UPI00248B0A25|nr:hypothetical protein [Paenibacillus dendritiformis]WGU92057.1 hypothetical protein QJQ58_15705 [Paenibacillus dendritiformis]
MELINYIQYKDNESFNSNLDKYSDFVSWGRFFPDLWYDLIKPETGGITLDLDQRVYLRCVARFLHNYMIFPRGYSKTLLEVLGLIHAGVWFPDVDLSLSAQTKENSASLLAAKWDEAVKYYPLLKNEIIGDVQRSKDSFMVRFKSGGKIDVLANSQNSKGQRRHRINIEESAQIKADLFEDALAPIPSEARRTIGKLALKNPEEMNGQINFMTTSWFRGSSEFERNLIMLKEMAELKGSIVLGSDWRLAANYGRGRTKSEILKIKEKTPPISFAMNYESKWVGQVNGALVDIIKVMDLRVIPNPELKGDGKTEYCIAMDVARSQSKSNNQSSIAVLKVIRDKNNKIKNIKLVNIINLPNGLDFTAQTVELKRIKNLYDAKFVVVDANNIGQGIVDEALKDTIDPDTGESLGCWKTINTEQEPEVEDAEEILFALKSQGINTDIIVNFINIIESGKLQLLVKKQDFDGENTFPHLQTDFFIEEVANLKLKELNGGKLDVEQATRKIDKDRYSAVAYGCYYLMKYQDEAIPETGTSVTDFMFIN